MKKLLTVALLCFASVAFTDTYYEKTTIKSPNSLSQTFDVVSYGAKCDASTDDTTSIQAAINAAKTFYGLSAFNTIKILFPPKSLCVITDTLNFTGFTTTTNKVIVEGQGAELTAHLTGKAVIDAMDSQQMMWRDLDIHQSQGTATTGIQVGRTVTNTSGAFNNEFQRFQIYGSFSVGACYLFAVEQTSWIDVTCSNLLTTGGFGLVMDGNNHWNVSTLAPGGQHVAADTPSPMSLNTFINGSFLSVSGPNGAAMWIQTAENVNFVNSYGYDAPNGTGGSCVWLYFADNSATNYTGKLYNFDLHCEPTLTYQFWITGPGSGATFTATPTLFGLYFKELDVHAATDIFKIDPASNITTLNLENADLNLAPSPVSPSFRVFDSASSYVYSGRYASDLTASWNGLSTWDVDLNLAGVVTHQVSNLSISATAASTFGTTGSQLNVPSQTINDATSSGTTTQTYVNLFGIPTLTSTSALGLTTASTVAILGAPVASTNVTITNPFAFRVFGGASRFDGALTQVGLLTTNGGITATGAAISLNASSNFTTNIGTGTTTQTVTIGGGADAVTLNATTLTLTGTLAGTSISNYLLAPGPIGSGTPSTGAFTTLGATGLITPSTTVGIKGTAAADVAQAGSIGESPTVNCPSASTATVTMTIATPAVVTWSAHPFSGAEVSAWTCAINFTNSGGALPTGIVAGTNYFIDGATLSGDTFDISDTAAHALAGTNHVATSGSQSGTQTGWIGTLMSTGTAVVALGMNATAGDYDCSGDATFAPVTTLTTTGWGAVLNTSNSVTFNHGQAHKFQVASLSVGTTVFDWPLPVVRSNQNATASIVIAPVINFSGGSVNGGGILRCRRAR